MPYVKRDLIIHIGQRTFRVATFSRQDGLLALEVYEIRLPRLNDPTSRATITLLPRQLERRNNVYAGGLGLPPPSFNRAINMPSPPLVSEDIPALYTDVSNDLPPPRYDEIVSISTISGRKVREDED